MTAAAMTLAADKPLPPAPRDRRRRPAPPRWSGRNGYSYFVSLMKFTLPVVAVVLVGLIVFWQQIMPNAKLLSADISDLSADMAKNLVMIGPRYDGIDQNGRPYSLTASVARQVEDNEDVMLLLQPTADMTLEDGAWAALSADKGRYNRKTEKVFLVENVNFFHDRGFELRAPYAEIDFVTSTARGDKGVEGQGPSGIIVAEGFVFQEAGGVMLFTGQSHLTVLPEPAGDKAPGGDGATGGDKEGVPDPILNLPPKAAPALAQPGTAG